MSASALIRRVREVPVHKTHERGDRGRASGGRGGIGRRTGFKFQVQRSADSTPAARTNPCTAHAIAWTAMVVLMVNIPLREGLALRFRRRPTMFAQNVEGGRG